VKFKLSRDRAVLQLAVRAAVAAHRPQALHQLLAARGHSRFASALAALPVRIADDAVSMLEAGDRDCVAQLLSIRRRAGPGLRGSIQCWLSRLAFSRRPADMAGGVPGR
jgi:hypothetical protein